MSAATALALGLLAGMLWEFRHDMQEWVEVVLDCVTPRARPASTTPPAPHPFGPAVTWLGGLAAYDVVKDQKRQEKNLVEFGAALLGDRTALAYLRQRSGRYGVAQVEGHGEVGGWASRPSREDAWAKYREALAQVEQVPYEQ